MQLRRALPLSLVALLASAGCVSVGPAEPVPGPVTGPARGPVPPVAAPDAPVSLPLGNLPALPRRARTPGPASGRPRRTPVPPADPARVDGLCAAAEGAVPPSIVDLCLRQYGR
ncbi:hypothetical protein [Streptomyces sp. NPDC091371]|uniref:hypothetical protein n=1 Tax=Streptomyces sp. NPDC091371 TaxID=3155303 RepID=UPI00343C5F55